MRELKLELHDKNNHNPELEAAIATTWPQQLTQLATLDLFWSRLGPAATTALLYDMPSLTSLKCWGLSAPTRQQLVTQLKHICVVRTDLPTLASLQLGPQCNLTLSTRFLPVEDGMQQLTAAADTLRHCVSFGLDGCEMDGPLQAEASERVVRTLAAGLREGSHRVEYLQFHNFTFQQSSGAALVELLQATSLVDTLCFE